MSITTAYYFSPSPLAQDWAGTGEVEQKRLRKQYSEVYSFIEKNYTLKFVEQGVMHPVSGYIVFIENSNLFATYEVAGSMRATFGLTLQQAKEKLAYIEVEA